MIETELVCEDCGGGTIHTLIGWNELGLGVYSCARCDGTTTSVRHSLIKGTASV